MVLNQHCLYTPVNLPLFLLMLSWIVIYEYITEIFVPSRAVYTINLTL